MFNAGYPPSAAPRAEAPSLNEVFIVCQRLDCRPPRAVLAGDLTPPRSPQSRGDGKNPAPISDFLMCNHDPAFLTPPSLRSAINKG
jgi:hypothetical protein